MELPLLTGEDPALPYNHSAEVTIAARGKVVVAAPLNMHLQGTDTYQYTSADFRKRVAINVSHDAGKTFSVIDAGLGDGTFLGDQTTDPVVRVARDGTFFAVVLRSKMEGDGAVASSADGTNWVTIATLTVVDKPWLGVDDERHELFIGAAAGFMRLGFDGSLRQQVSSAMPFLISDACTDSGGAYFATEDAQVLHWDGSTAEPQLAATFDRGPDADLYTSVTWNYGRLLDGSWSVRARREGKGTIVLRVERGADIVETPLTGSDANAFFPTAAIDDGGKLHVAWYDSAGTAGRLLYTHSRGVAPFADGFIEPIVVDDNATPGNNWNPGFDQNSGDRRLREYIGITVSDGVAYVAWTHSPAPPSRVFVATIRH